jgi:putative ABC transport system substrate-binding protein
MSTRREFVTLLGGAAFAVPFEAGPQQRRCPWSGSITMRHPALRFGIPHWPKGEGYVEGQKLAIEYRWAENQIDRLPELATDLIRDQVGVHCQQHDSRGPAEGPGI